MGALLIALTAGMLVFDRGLGPWYPFLLLFFVVLGPLACDELFQLLGPERLLPRWFCHGSVLTVLLANWPAHLGSGLTADPWHYVLGAFTTVALCAFIVEMATYREPGGSVGRIAAATWTVAYLGVLPSFLAQLRWLRPFPWGESSGDGRGVAALALAIFVPKACDIGAFFTGKLVGRHRMTPVLSPNKTWEGFAGGMTFSTLVAVGIQRGWPTLAGGDLAAVGFGLSVGLAAVLGDLAESLVKRDCRQKDASQTVPGFGGVLDVIDSIVFAAPVAYLWLRSGT
jgi:phosphatidate cytidylyltransferase